MVGENIKVSSEKNIKCGAILTYVTQFLNIVISFIYVPIMLNKLGQSEYGLYSIVQSLISYLQMSEMGIGTTATRYNSKYISENDKNGQKVINGMFFKMYIGIACVCTVIAIIIFFFLDNIYYDYSPENVNLIKVLFIIAVINLVVTFVFQIFNAIIIAYEDYIFLKILILIRTLLGPVGMLTVLFLGAKSIGMLCVTTALSLTFGLIEMIFCLKKYRISFTFRHNDSKLFKTVFSFTIFVFINSLATQLMMNSDKFLISIIMTEYAVAVYSIVMQFHMYSYTFANVLSGFYLPKFTKIITKEKKLSKELEADLVKTGRIQVLIAGLIFGGFLSIGKPFIVRWVGVEYSEAYILSIIVLLTEVIGASQSMFNSLMQAMNLHKTRGLLSLAVSGIKILFTIVFTKYFGLLGCAVAFFIGWFIKQIVFNIYYKRVVKMDITLFWKKMLKMFVPIAITIFLIQIIILGLQKIVPAYSYLLIAMYIFIYLILYLVIMWMIGLNKYEKSLIKSLFKRKG